MSSDNDTENTELAEHFAALHRTLRNAGYDKISTDPMPGCQPCPSGVITPCEVERLMNERLLLARSVVRVRITIDDADPSKMLVRKVDRASLVGVRIVETAS